MKIMTLQTIFLGLGLIFGDARANAQDSAWARQMFDKLEHDFGVVARGTDARYHLTITNKYKETVHIAGVTTSCGCTAAKPGKDTLVSNESTDVEITMNTIKFEGHKPSSVTVVFDRPAYAEVRIPIHAFIRKDVVLSPGGAQFGTVKPGQDAERTIAIAYAGRGNWKIKNVLNKNPNLDAQIVEIRRDATYVNYQLNITLKAGARVGEFRDQVTLVTDDSANPYVPVLVEGRIEEEFSVNPEVVSFGQLAPGERKTVNVVIRGPKPFSIENIESSQSAGVFEVQLPKDAKRIHVVPLTVIAPHDPQPIHEDFYVTISEQAVQLTFKAYGNVVPASVPVVTGNDAASLP